MLQVIARTRVEIKAIRTKYAALKARRIPLTEQGMLCLLFGLTLSLVYDICVC